MLRGWREKGAIGKSCPFLFSQRGKMFVPLSVWVLDGDCILYVGMCVQGHQAYTGKNSVH